MLRLLFFTNHQYIGIFLPIIFFDPADINLRFNIQKKEVIMKSFDLPIHPIKLLVITNYIAKRSRFLCMAVFALFLSTAVYTQKKMAVLQLL